MEYKQNFSIDFSLSGKTAIVTGAANGIGRAIALMYAQKGANLVLADISADVRQVEDTIAGHGQKAVSVVGDLAQSDYLAKIVEAAESTFGKIDILVNCAGVVFLDDAENLSESNWDTTMQINLKSAFLLSQLAAKHMMQHGGGKILNLASQASVIALDKHVAYCASKAAMVSMTRVMAAEWAEFDISVNAISPTVVLTALGEKAWAGQKGEDMKKLIPAGRFAYPDEIAACAVFLASDAANMITGENLVIDGGYTIQ